MKRFYVILLSLTVIAIVVFTLRYCFVHKTRYLNLKFSDIGTASDKHSTWVEINPTRMEVNGLRLKGYPDETVFTDEQIIKKVINYLNRIPLVSVKAHFDKSTRVLVISELSDTGYNFITGGNERRGSLYFYNDKGFAVGSVTIYNEEYMINPNYQAYKVRDEGTFIISGLEALDLD